MARKNRRVVPVVHREEAPRGPSLQVPRVTLSGTTILVVLVAIMSVLWLISVPVRNYLQQRAEIARVSASIAHLENTKADLVEQVEKYQSEEYIKEQARIRLGLIEPGETAFRVVDPAFDNPGATEELDGGATAQGPWYAIVWDSVSLAEALEEGQAEATETPTSNLPLAPTESQQQ